MCQDYRCVHHTWEISVSESMDSVSFVPPVPGMWQVFTEYRLTTWKTDGRASLSGLLV